MPPVNTGASSYDRRERGDGGLMLAEARRRGLARLLRAGEAVEAPG